MTETIGYIHIPKTAGTTLTSILQRNYPEAVYYSSPGGETGLAYLRALSEQEKRALTLIYGHIPYGIHTILGKSVTYLTMLRHPVKRIISHYHYVKRLPEHYLHDTVTSNAISLKEYATSGMSSELDNGQVRLLYGIDGEQIEKVNQEHYVEALRNLRDNIIAVGIQECFDESILLFQHKLGWRLPFYRRQNVNRASRRNTQIDISVVRTIEDYNQFDMALYEEATKVFQEQVRDVPMLRIKKTLFRLSNHIINQLRR